MSFVMIVMHPEEEQEPQDIDTLLSKEEEKVWLLVAQWLLERECKGALIIINDNR